VTALLQRKPLLSVAAAAGELNLTAPTVRSAIENLETLGLVREATGKRRDRLFVYSRYLDVLQQDTEESFGNS
jgi:predicted ArsR family transcriptional regulator